ncbi:hypothetical protein ACFQ5D_23935 [Paenibacillus farraposensis]|uniref:Uncharacterized protein n=1 Tax=Paenibacillus farraposensis TaxID=2807095 RepID=A0ABW4DI34_9BACL|nr:hypothetical protein [Paenibacillus farraposensis]MCC3378018.1 hypothetical protein [Paenibacillus farraposensis]
MDKEAKARKSMKILPTVKAEVEKVQKEWGFKTEGHALAYLLVVYKDQKGKNITIEDHQRYLKESVQLMWGASEDE